MIADITVEVEILGDVATLRVSGELDVATAPVLGEELDRLAEASPPVVVIELAQVTFLGSAGLGVLVQARRDFAARGTRLLLAKANDAVLRVMQIVHLDQVFEFDPPLPGPS